MPAERGPEGAGSAEWGCSNIAAARAIPAWSSSGRWVVMRVVALTAAEAMLPHRIRAGRADRVGDGHDGSLDGVR